MAPRLIPRGRVRARAAQPGRILVLKFGGMGEAVLARSVMDGLLERNPVLTIDYLVEQRTVEVMTLGRTDSCVFRYSPSTDGLGAALKVLRAVRRNRYDAVVDFEQHSLLTAVFCRATSIPLRAGFLPSVSNDRDRMFTHAVALREGESMWKAFVHLGQVLDPGLPESLTTTPVPTSADAESWMDDWWGANVGEDRSGPVVVMLGLAQGARTDERVPGSVRRKIGGGIRSGGPGAHLRAPAPLQSAVERRYRHHAPGRGHGRAHRGPVWP